MAKKSQLKPGQLEPLEPLNPLPDIDEQTLRYFKTIETQCSQALSIFKSEKKFLYRGIRNTPYDAFVGKPRQDRKPKDSSVGQQERLDTALASAGFKALRKNSIFATSVGSRAAMYGQVFLVFPKNGFHFTWSTRFDDLIIDDMIYHDYEAGKLEAILYNMNNLLHLYKDNHKIEGKTLRYFNEFETYFDAFNPNTFNEKQFNLAQKAFVFFFKIEEQINDVIPITTWFRNLAKKYITLKISTPQQMALKFVLDHGFTKIDFAGALRSGHEICINGEYICLKALEYKKQASKYFGIPV